MSGFLSHTKMSLADMFFKCINGNRAQCVQSYDEMNKKQGKQWESSRFIDVPGSSNVDMIIVVGNKPVDLKQLCIGTTSPLLTVEIFKAPTYSGTGTILPIYNMNTAYAPNTSLTKFYSGFTVSNTGTKIGADIVILGPASWSQEGVAPNQYASNRILEAGAKYLVRLNNSQTTNLCTCAIRTEFYEGDLDYPNIDFIYN